MELIEKIKKEKFVILTPKQDITLTVVCGGVYLKAGKDYKVQLRVSEPWIIEVFLLPSDPFEIWHFFLQDVNKFFFSKEFEREKKLKEIGI